MANISIRNLDDSIKEALRLRAAAEHCSMEEFLRRCLAAAVEKGSSPAALVAAGNAAGATEWPGQAVNEQSFAAAGAGDGVKALAAGFAAPDFTAKAEEATGPGAAGAAGKPQFMAGQAAATKPQFSALQGKNIVLIIGGSIAAYKALELIRLLRRARAVVRVIMTAAAQQFITPLAVGALAGGPVYRHLFVHEGEPDLAPGLDARPCGGECQQETEGARASVQTEGARRAVQTMPDLGGREGKDLGDFGRGPISDLGSENWPEQIAAGQCRENRLGAAGGKSERETEGARASVQTEGARRAVQTMPGSGAGLDTRPCGGAPHMVMAGSGREQVREIGHIQLARQADIVLVCAATASRLAKMAAGQADDLAGAVLLATRAPVLLAPAMNPAMWAHKATQRNVALLRRDGCHIIGPERGEMAESGEAGLGRMSEPAAIIAALATMAANMSGLAVSRQLCEGRAGSGADGAASSAGATFSGTCRPEQGVVFNPVCGERKRPAPVSAATDSVNPGACRQGNIAGSAADLAGAGEMAFTGDEDYATAGQNLAVPRAPSLAGRHIIVTSGPTHEALDPVRYLANRSSGKQGHALAAALAACGARVTLVCGPVLLPDPPGVEAVHVTSARQMRAAVLAALPADAAIFVAAVADWRPQYVFSDKIKKPKIRIIAAGSSKNKAEAAAAVAAPAGSGVEISAGQVKLTLVENPDILAEIGHNLRRPRLVVGFAAETRDVLENAAAKLAKKGADWIIANNVAATADGSSIMGGDHNHIHILSREGVEEWPEMSKIQVAARLAEKIAAFFCRSRTKITKAKAGSIVPG